MPKYIVYISIIVALTLLPIPLIAAAMASADQSPNNEILCIFDFIRHGQDAGMDWLQRGLPDMMITTMNWVSSYQIVDRADLKAILQKHDLSPNGLVEMASAATAGKLAKAQYFIVGNFERQHTRITVEVRLLRTADQQLLATATWEGHPRRVISAPRALSETLLANVNEPFDAELLQGIETRLPGTIDSAEAFYNGMEAFDHGRYAESLAHYLDGSGVDRTFIRVKEEIIRVYDLLGHTAHAISFASDVAQSFEKSDTPQALAFYYEAAEKSMAALNDTLQAISFLEQMTKIAERYESRTHEAEQTKQLVQARALALFRTGTYKSPMRALTHKEFRYLLWYREIEEQLKEMQHNGGYQWIQREGQWRKVPIPRPSVWMWKLRAQLTLARLYVQDHQLRSAFAIYKNMIQDYEFVRSLSVPSEHRSFYWTDGLRLELVFMALHHYENTGEFIRDDLLLSTLNEITAGAAFERVFKNLQRDPRAAIWSRREDGGHEYFHFVAPKGYQIDAVTLEAKVRGLAKFSVELPETTGWPPPFGRARRLQTLTFFQGTHTKKIAFSAATGFFSLNTMWGVRWADTQMEYYRGMGSKAADQSDIVWWRATFHLSPKQGIPVAIP